MSSTLTFRSRKPESGDSGASSVFSDLEFNIDKNDRHIHNGLESSKLTVPAIAVTTQSILAAGWGSADGNGLFTQTVTLPTALTDTPLTDQAAPGDMTYDTLSMEFRLTSTGEILQPKVVKVSSTTYDITVNDNTIDITAIYTT